MYKTTDITARAYVLSNRIASVLNLKAIGVGVGSTLFLAITAELARLYLLMSLSGVLGGVFISIVLQNMGENGWRINGRHGFIGVGFAGIIFFFYISAISNNLHLIPQPTPILNNIIIFLTTSPLVIITFAIEGGAGGLIGIGFSKLATYI